MKNLILSKAEARRLLLAYQGLWPPYGLDGKEGALQYIRRVGCIQFDPLNIAGRNPELVLQARVSRFKPEMLRELLYQDRRLLDGWDKMMSIYPVEDWPYFRRCREAAFRKLAGRSPSIARILPEVHREIREQGPVSSLDLNFDQMVDWPWAPTRLARAALESLYFQGELVIHHKINTRKIYDFADRHLPEELLNAPDPNQNEADYQDWRILRRIGGVGLLWNKSGDAWLGIDGVKAQERNVVLARLVKRENVKEISVEGIKTPFYFPSRDWPFYEKALKAETPPLRGAILGPLDNLLWDRRLVKELFDFDYRWEVYKPVNERRYGYYVLPVLYGDRFVARFEPERNKQDGALIIKNWWWETGVGLTKQLQTALRECFKSFADFLDAPRLEVDGGALEWLTD